MSSSTQANRGMALENFVKFANERYENHGIAIIEKIPTEFIPIRNRTGKIVSVKVEHKSTVDFIGRYKEYPIAIEAKNTNQDTIRWDAVQPHQAAFLDKFTEQPGTIGLVLVSFGLKDFYAVPWAFWGAAYDLRVRRDDRTTSKRVKAFDEEWTIPTKKSARIEEMSPLWRVSGQDTVYGLGYLKNAERYITMKNPEKAGKYRDFSGKTEKNAL